MSTSKTPPCLSKKRRDEDRAPSGVLLQSLYHIRLRQHLRVNVGVGASVARKTRAAHARHSGREILPEGFPELHLAGGDVNPVHLGGPFAALAGEGVQRGSVRRPPGDVIFGIEFRNRAQTAAVERPNTPFAVWPSNRHAAAVRRHRRTRRAFGCERFGIAVTQINQIIADAVSGLDSGGQQLLAIRQVTYGSITDIVVS